MRSESEVLASHITRIEKLWQIHLPKQVRDMNVKEFVEVYNGDVNLAMQSFKAPVNDTRGARAKTAAPADGEQYAVGSLRSPFR